MRRISSSDQVVEALVGLYDDAWTEAGGGGRRRLGTLRSHLARLEVELPAEEAEAFAPVLTVCTERMSRLWVRRTPPDRVASLLARHLLRKGVGAAVSGARPHRRSLWLAISPGGWQTTESLFEPGVGGLIEVEDFVPREEGLPRLEKALAHERKVAARDAADEDRDPDDPEEPWAPDPDDPLDVREAAGLRGGHDVDVWFRTTGAAGQCEVLVSMTVVGHATLARADWEVLRGWEQAHGEHAPGSLNVDEALPEGERYDVYAWGPPASERA